MNPTYSTPLAIYLRLTDAGGKTLGADGTPTASTSVNTAAFDANSLQFIKVLAYSSGVEQTLNIGSQSTGAGAGKITFNPLVLSKYMDATSPILFQNAAAGTAYKTAELFFVNAQNMVVLKHTYKLVAVKTVAWSASGDAGVLENISFDYGSQVVTATKQAPDGKIVGNVQAGWNRVRNTPDNDPDSPINK